jgi:UDP-N-acetyl-alpha-D-muramoyl-L-alanyl-L-glutamate epimerase
MSRFTIHAPEIIGNKAVFRYSYESYSFTETHIFPFTIAPYKSLYTLAQTIHIEWHLEASEKTFWEWIFRNGFSELVHRNTLSWEIVDRITISHDNIVPTHHSPSSLKHEALVGIGGGKDSTVVVELLKKMNIPLTGYALKSRPTPVVEDTVASLAIPFHSIVRKLDPQLTTLQKVYHGHIPISLVYAAAGCVIAEHTSTQYVVVGNETSADESNTVWRGRGVNHQWSKTYEFEERFANYVRMSIHPSLYYFSLLRPLAGAKVAELFAKLCSVHYAHFSSCNRNFTVTQSQNVYWCGSCAKCLGTWILLAPHITHDVLLSIFHKNILDDVTLIPLLRELVGLSPVKPFDCVATRDEMCHVVARIQNNAGHTKLLSLLTSSEWKHIRARASIGTTYTQTLFEHSIPDELASPLMRIVDKIY